MSILQKIAKRIFISNSESLPTTTKVPLQLTILRCSGFLVVQVKDQDSGKLAWFKIFEGSRNSTELTWTLNLTLTNGCVVAITHEAPSLAG